MDGAANPMQAADASDPAHAPQPKHTATATAAEGWDEGGPNTGGGSSSTAMHEHEQQQCMAPSGGRLELLPPELLLLIWRRLYHRGFGDLGTQPQLALRCSCR